MDSKQSVEAGTAKMANVAKETQLQKLERLQNQTMTKLGERIRQSKTVSTTSPEVLHMAREAKAGNTVPEKRPRSATTVILTSPPRKAEQEPAVPREQTKTTSHARAIRSGISQRASSQNGPSPSYNRGKGRMRGARRGSRGRWNHPSSRGEAGTAHQNVTAGEVPDADANIADDLDIASADSVVAMDDGSPVKNDRPVPINDPSVAESADQITSFVQGGDSEHLNHDQSTFKARFGSWNDKNAARTMNEATGWPAVKLPVDLVKDFNLIPDGLSLVDRTRCVNMATYKDYDFSDAVGDVLLDAGGSREPFHPALFEEDWGKLDMKDSENVKSKDECVEYIIRNYKVALKRQREEEIRSQQDQRAAQRQFQSGPPRPNPHIPRLNIYLRPAVASDVPQLLQIYNHYATKSVRCSEMEAVSGLNMSDRFEVTTQNKLPFLVAAFKSAPTKPVTEIDMDQDKVVGWASATDWVNRHSSERFTVELEVYVHKDHLRQGVGKCLMDKLLEATDRGHIPRKGCPFFCDPEVQHLYTAGGARNLIRLMILVRSFDKPKPGKEDDLPWLKKWLEDSWQFEQQGCLKRVAAKFKRYVNHIYFVRSTAYSPAEREVPDD